MYCINCGTDNEDDSIFCINCGICLQNGIDITNDHKIIKKYDKPDKIGIRKTNILIIIIAIIIVLITSILLYNNKIYDDKDRQGQDLAKISISSKPLGANIYINDIYNGKTPIDIKLPEGDYHLKTNITGYKGIRTDFNVTRDMERQEIYITFEPIDNESSKMNV